MSTVQTFAAGLALIRDLFLLVIFALAGGPVIDTFAFAMGNMNIQDRMFYFIQPAFGWFYALIFLAGIVRFGWFFLISIRRVDYTADYGQY